MSAPVRRNPTTAAVVANRARAKSGKAAHALAVEANDFYAARGLARVWHSPPPVIKTRDKGIVYSGKGPVDFIGYMRRESTGFVAPVLYDMKSCTKATLTYPRDKFGRVQQTHQLDDLLAAQQDGVTAFLLVHDQSLGMNYIVSRRAHLETLREGLGVCLRDLARDGTITPYDGILAFPETDLVDYARNRAPWCHWLPVAWELHDHGVDASWPAR